MYAVNTVQHNGGGWIASLEQLVHTVPDIQLGIAFEHTDTNFRVERDGVVYYPLKSKLSVLEKIKFKLGFGYKIEEKKLLPKCMKIIDDFKPDIIHIFGSEEYFGLVAEHTEIPVVIHIQGSIPPYYNARFPPGYSRFDLAFNNGLNIGRIAKDFKNDFVFVTRAKREERILRACHYYMGRTEWDKNISKLYNPDSQYFYCSEALRNVFVNAPKKWEKHEREKVILVSTISSPFYKGIDLVLKTSKLLKENTEIDFDWRIFGVTDIAFHEKKTKIKKGEVNVKLMGIASAEKLKEELLDADIFIHPSYIDNSPNSICEAQILGLPVISTNVGGISSLIKHKETGLLIPANDPFTLVCYIKLLLQDKTLMGEIGENAQKTAIKRHDPQMILKDLLNTYQSIKNSMEK
jgi:glycosyltransferase involved in cell wall biosynthesis